MREIGIVMGTRYVDFCVDLPGNGARNPSCYLLSTALVCLEEERVMRQSSVSIFLGSQKLMEILTLLCCITISSSREYNACSRSSKKNFWRSCPGGLRKSHIPSTHNNPYLSHYIICHLPLVFLFPTSSFPFLRLFIVCLFVCPCASLIACRHG